MQHKEDEERIWHNVLIPGDSNNNNKYMNYACGINEDWKRKKVA